MKHLEQWIKDNVEPGNPGDEKAMEEFIKMKQELEEIKESLEFYRGAYKEEYGE